MKSLWRMSRRRPARRITQKNNSIGGVCRLKQKEPAVLPDVQEQNRCSVAGAELKEGQTSPPKHFTEDLLLHAMETASADSMPEGVERQGIGTPATRAATIEKLVQKGFLERKGNKKTKVLLPTDKGKALITVMPEEIQSPEMTADWETKLLQIERGEMEPSEFMTEINTMITELVKNTEMKKGANALMKNKIIGVCPNCGANIVNILGNRIGEGFKGGIILLKSIEHFIFQPAKEGLHNAIVVAVALSGHGLNDSVLLKFATVECLLVLPALIRVHDQTLYRGKAFKCLVQHISYLLHIRAGREVVRNNLICVHIQNRRNIALAPRQIEL